MNRFKAIHSQSLPLRQYLSRKLSAAKTKPREGPSLAGLCLYICLPRIGEISGFCRPNCYFSQNLLTTGFWYAFLKTSFEHSVSVVQRRGFRWSSYWLLLDTRTNYLIGVAAARVSIDMIMPEWA